MRCPHGTVTTEEVMRRYSRAEILTAWMHMLDRLANVESDALIQIAAIRELLGRLARERWHCDCDLEPFALQGTRPAGNGAH